MNQNRSSQSLVASGAGVVGLQSIAPLPATPGTVVIRPVRVGLCGTDLEIIGGTIDPDFISYPIVLGHEWSGIIEELGDGVDGELAVGDLVVVEGIVPCGHCARCREGATNLCETKYDELGFTRNGAAGPSVVARAELVHRIEHSVGPDAAALIEPAAVVYRALRRAPLRPAARILVIGAGTIGLLAARLVSLWSPASITVLDRRAEQSDLAFTAGATAFASDAAELTGGFDVVIEAAGSAATVLIALAQAARGGTVVLLGYPGDGVTTPVAVDDVINNDLLIVGSFAYTSAIWREVVALLNSGRVSFDFLVTHRFAFAEWEQAIDALRGAQGARAKVMLELDR
jgi:2-desacetyl-2-hydroxyethyl bacteriochlorophyllide A dehydrogenase